jgi:hypothetical protein
MTRSNRTTCPHCGAGDQVFSVIAKPGNIRSTPCSACGKTWAPADLQHSPYYAGDPHLGQRPRGGRLAPTAHGPGTFLGYRSQVSPRSTSRAFGRWVIMPWIAFAAVFLIALIILH